MNFKSCGHFENRKFIYMKFSNSNFFTVCWKSFNYNNLNWNFTLTVRSSWIVIYWPFYRHLEEWLSLLTGDDQMTKAKICWYVYWSISRQNTLAHYIGIWNTANSRFLPAFAYNPQLLRKIEHSTTCSQLVPSLRIVENVTTRG